MSVPHIAAFLVDFYIFAEFRISIEIFCPWLHSEHPTGYSCKIYLDFQITCQGVGIAKRLYRQVHVANVEGLTP